MTQAAQNTHYIHMHMHTRTNTHIYPCQAGFLTQYSPASASCVEMLGFCSHWGDNNTDHQLKAQRGIVLYKHTVSYGCF